MVDIVKLGYDKIIVDMLYEYGADILGSSLFNKERQFIQHGDTTTFDHSLCVAYISLWLAVRSKHKVDLRSVTRGALLHDYFLYDWHEKNEYHNLHGFTHALKSLANAKRDFDLNRVEEEIIYCHMFPLNLTRVPRSREARIVCIADKLCAGAETLSILHYNPAMVQV